MSLEGFADGLADEVMAEMAENFFSARKRVDDLLERFDELRMELKSIQERAELAAETLHFLLLDEENVVDFYERLGLYPDELPLCFDCTVPPRVTKMPRALTTRGRFTKLVKSKYEDFARAVEEYMRGSHRPDPANPARLVQTVNYHQIMKLAECINTSIEKLNSEMPASGVLCYAKKMDPVQLEREKVTGGGCEMGGTSLDADLAFEPIDVNTLGLNHFPEVPMSGECERVIDGFCREFYSANKARVREALAMLKAASGKDSS